MSTDTNEPHDREWMEKIDVRVPPTLLEDIEEEYNQRGYTSRSDAIRDALRDWVSPPATLSKEALTDLQESRQQAEQGETVSVDEARKRSGLDD